jgi:tetratricopeptide (TPR) repeat protein
MMLLILAGLLAAQPAIGATARTADGGIDRILTSTGYYAGVDETGGNTLLKLHDMPLRFQLPQLSEAELQRWAALIGNAAQRGFALRVRFDGTAGHVDPHGAAIVYPLCSLTVGNVAPLGDEAVNCPIAAAPDQPASYAALARGVAIARTYQRAALQALSEALAGEDLPPNLRAVALGARAEIDGALAREVEWGGEAFDRLTIAALADSRERVGINPDDIEANYAVGMNLTELGAYDEALAIYANIGRRWPDDALRVATRTGAIYRQRGDYRRALATLDDFAARSGRPDGMRFAYHRAWTLVMLDRFREALTEIDAGLRTQPDYAAAWELRSCINAQLGAIDEARSDEERAVELLEDLVRDGEPGLVPDIERSRRLVTMLRRRASAEALDLACRAPWERHAHARPRSALLGAEPR